MKSPASSAKASATPRVSVVIPAYDQPDLLHEALRSVTAQHGAEFCEVIVTDDCGSPNTRDVVEMCGHPHVQYHQNPQRLGAVANWNRALGLARGEWVTVLHEDDLLYPWYLATVTPRLRPGLSAVAVRCERGAVPGRISPPRPPISARAYPPQHFLKSATTPFPGVTFHRATAERLGGFDPKWGPLADYDFWYRLAQAGRTEVLSAAAAFYRVRDDQWTTQAWPRMLRLTHLLRLRIAREQFPQSPRIARWLARFFTVRNARGYRNRFGEGELILDHVAQFERIRGANLPSGWVWAFLKLLSAERRRAPAADLDVPHRLPSPALISTHSAYPSHDTM